MITFGLFVGIAACTGIGGFAIGWIVRSQVVPAEPVGHGTPAVTAPPVIAPPQPAYTATMHEPTPASTMEIVNKLLELTENVSTSLNHHTGRVLEINQALNTIKSSDSNSVVVIVAQLVENNKAMQSRLESSELKLQAQQRELQTQTQAALTDPLTKLTNRRALDMQMKRYVADFQQKGRPFSTMLVDIDHFKQFNDTHGHLAGDEVLKYVANTLKQSCDDTMTVARYGGEEFSIVAPGETIQQSMQKLERIRAALQLAKVTFEGKDLRVTASAGIAELMVGEDQTHLFKRADMALYASKHAGRNCSHFHDGSESIRITLEAEPAMPAATPEVPRMVDIRRDAPQAFRKEEATEPTAAPTAICLPIEKSPLLGFAAYDQLDVNFRGNIERRIAETKRDTSTFSLVFSQLDCFDRLEADYGQAVGETVLKVTSQFLRANMRDMDQLVRVGRCGFALMLPGAHAKDAASVVGEHLRKTVSGYELPSSRGPVRFTISVGTTEALPQDDVNSLFDRAKGALEAAITAGCNCGYMNDGKQLSLVRAAANSESVS